PVLLGLIRDKIAKDATLAQRRELGLAQANKTANEENRLPRATGDEIDAYEAVRSIQNKIKGSAKDEGLIKDGASPELLKLIHAKIDRDATGSKRTKSALKGTRARRSKKSEKAEEPEETMYGLQEANWMASKGQLPKHNSTAAYVAVKYILMLIAHRATTDKKLIERGVSPQLLQLIHRKYR